MFECVTMFFALFVYFLVIVNIMLFLLLFYSKNAVMICSFFCRRNHNTEHNRQFAGQLLGMTLNFLLRLTRSQSYTEDLPPVDQDSFTSRDAPVALSSSVESSSGTYWCLSFPRGFNECCFGLFTYIFHC